MIFRGEGDPFMLVPESLDNVRALVVRPMETAMQGLQYLEHFGLTHEPDWAARVQKSQWFWPMVVGLGFGVRMSLELLEGNAPDADISGDFRLYDERLSKSDGSHFAGYELADIVPNAHQVAGRVFDPNVLRAITLYALPQFNFRPEHERMLLASMVHGHGWVREAFELWEFNHPVETAERIATLNNR